MNQRRADCLISADAFEAIIFDLDGVITDTASVHAAAWKGMLDELLLQHSAREGVPFKAFEIDSDYRTHVDGKPRLDGLKSFLGSRGIQLPEGGPEDRPGADTIHNLAKRKNSDFLKRIQEQGVKVYGSTRDLIHSAKKHGLKTAVISSSKSCAMILDSVNLSELFDVRVDGVDSEVLGLAGKPAPDIFLEAARQLQVKPERAVVVEDAVSGVQAGRAGGFGLVIGIARTGGKEDLQGNGADAVVQDLSEICVAAKRKEREPLPSALDDFERILRMAQGKRLAVFLDYDGTLSPIAETPEQAVMPENIREAVTELSRHCAVGVISGRDLKDVQDKVRMDSIVYAGSHGFDIAGPEGLQVERTVGEEFLPVLDAAERELSEKLGSIRGVLLERKKFAIAIHYRRVIPETVGRVEAIVDDIAGQHPELRTSYGKKIFELQPQIDWNKGKAVLLLLRTLKLDEKDVLPFYIGDDVTDEDAFRVLKGRGVGIVVRDQPYATAAVYSLKNPDEVGEFLIRLIPVCRRAS
ncbi:MAG: trehalose-phosphatase [Desulfobacterales bacterium]